MLFFTLPIIGVGVCTYLYFYKSESIKNTIAKTYWMLLRKKVQFDTYMQSDSKSTLRKKPDYYVVYNILSNNIKTMIDDNNTIDSERLLSVKNDLSDDTIIFRCVHDIDTMYYIRIENCTSIEDVKSFNVIESPFVEVEIEQKGTRKGIRDNLHHFYIKKNTILDEKFLKWYLKHFYNEELADSYTLHIMDNSINMLSISNTDEFYEKFVL